MFSVDVRPAFCCTGGSGTCVVLSTLAKATWGIAHVAKGLYPAGAVSPPAAYVPAGLVEGPAEQGVQAR